MHVSQEMTGVLSLEGLLVDKTSVMRPVERDGNAVLELPVSFAYDIPETQTIA